MLACRVHWIRALNAATLLWRRLNRRASAGPLNLRREKPISIHLAVGGFESKPNGAGERTRTVRHTNLALEIERVHMDSEKRETRSARKPIAKCVPVPSRQHQFVYFMCWSFLFHSHDLAPNEIERERERETSRDAFLEVHACQS